MMNMSGTGGYILHAFKMYVVPCLLLAHPDISFIASMIPMRKRYSYTAKRSAKSRNPLKSKGRQSHLPKTS